MLLAPFPIRPSLIARKLKVKGSFHCTSSMPFMSFSIPTQSISWNRVLPKPDYFNEPFPRRNSSLLQHHITSDKSFQPISDNIVGRRITVPSIAYSETPRCSSPTQSIVSSSRGSFSTFYTNEVPITRKRTASLMEDDLKSREPSPSTQNQNEESTNHFCLCQPDPKIPRPRNGKCFFHC